MKPFRQGDHLREWLLHNGPKSIYWTSFSTTLCKEQSKDILSDLQDIVLKNSEAEIAAFFADIKAELRTLAVKADAECEDQPVPQGWPEPTD